MKGISVKQIEEAIRASGGMLADAAQMLGCTHQNLCYRVGNSEQLQKVMKDHEKAFVKLAESQLIQAIREGVQASCMFYLKCKGGYKERHEINAQVNLTHDDWVKKMEEIESKKPSKKPKAKK